MFLAFGDDAALVFHDKVIAADDGPLVFYRRSYAVSDDVFHFGMHFLVDEISLSGGCDHGFCHGMRKVFLHAGCYPEQFVLAHAVGKRYDFDHRRIGLGQCSGLVEDYGVGFCDGFQIFSAFTVMLRLPASLMAERTDTGAVS